MGNNLQQLLPENVAQAVCRTLVHSLWQGLILAIFTGLVMLFTRRSSPAKRYRWLVGLLYIFSGIFFFALVVSWNTPTHIDSIMPNNNTGSPDIWELLNYNLLYVQKHAGIVVLIWLIVVCARSFKMLFGFYALERLKKTKVSRICAEWEQKLNALAQTMGIKRAVLLLESAIVRVPVVIGYLKPLILIPVGMVNALGPQEVEAILLHELAHIRRRDSLVNLLQNLVETTFFFNPAVLWLSSLIRAEREHCCDDMAVSHTKNKVRYITALIHFEEYALSNPGLAMALTGKSGGMLQRLERIAANRNRSLNKLEMAGLALLLLLSTLFIAARPSPKLTPTAGKTPAATLSPELRKYLHDRELAMRKHFLERKMEEGTATKADVMELSGYAHIQTPSIQIANIPMSPELRTILQEKERARAKGLREEEAARQRTRSKDSIPKN